MDKTLLRIIVGSVLLGVGKITYLKLTDGTEFKNPELRHVETEGKFGVKDPHEEERGDWTRAIELDEVEMLY